MWLGTLKTTNHYLFVPVIRFSMYVHSNMACFTGSFSYQDNQPDYSDYQQIMMSMTKKPEYHNTVNVFYQHRSRLFPVSDINFDKNSMQCKNFTQDFLKVHQTHQKSDLQHLNLLKQQTKLILCSLLKVELKMYI